jgi:uncharacterized membrane protein SirB2
MTLAAHFPQVLAVHVGSVALSGSLFSARAALRIAGRDGAAHHPVLRYASYLVDTTLLVAGIGLTLIVHQYPLVNAWLTTKVLLLILYIGVGSVALKRARSRSGRIAATLAAWTVFAAIIGVAVTRNPASWFALLRR